MTSPLHTSRVRKLVRSRKSVPARKLVRVWSLNSKVNTYLLERFCKTKMCTNFRSTSRSEKLRTNFRNFGRETCREREMNFRRKFREIGSCRTCTWRVQTTKMCRTESSCENSYTLSQGLSRNFVRTFVVQNLSIYGLLRYQLRGSALRKVEQLYVSGRGKPVNSRVCTPLTESCLRRVRR